MLPVPTVSFLAQFTGRDIATFTAYADEALLQATLLFSIVTQRTEFPDDEDLESLGVRAILEMADRIYLEQPYAGDRATPFASETIGSYSYAKYASAAARARDGIPTGLLWWDIAVDELSLAERSIVASGSVSNFERADVWTDTSGTRYVVGPGDADTETTPLYVNAELNPRPAL